MNRPEEHNLKGWLTELAALTTVEQCNDLFETLLVDRNKVEFENRMRRILSLTAHIRSYGLEDEEWQMAAKEQDHIDSEAAVTAYVFNIAPAFERTPEMTTIIDMIAVTHFLSMVKLAVLESEDALESSHAISALHELQPTQLGEHPFKTVLPLPDADMGEGTMKRAA
ncbi:hypothetical protein COU78_00275 [Candidatus Peregrinibacteria bacterium CG10_big_fil_rev_8_21_14_0_10_49_24]|nr:MAG: hypothetical protein COV83_06320 [Candidatus Peregrinibacteria bacterium CG11_big_fil_rev_8_21_14_0_20_49_14]PIR51624.1 MAG: hypothetical protein COU78_00275 [Candidatus Peregrinibacteria bacterium CG10_big_fil_rev_8_21_14_0_10_49_24]PJA68016.1 MAG: hypothetical protein CO157_01685 [Candidatus Peregrinibacteria bacterium CG_4_9_14_3_um_filter_49_12]